MADMDRMRHNTRSERQDRRAEAQFRDACMDKGMSRTSAYRAMKDLVTVGGATLDGDRNSAWYRPVGQPPVPASQRNPNEIPPSATSSQPPPPIGGGTWDGTGTGTDDDKEGIPNNDNRPRCDGCGLPMAYDDGSGYHVTCDRDED